MSFEPKSFSLLLIDVPFLAGPVASRYWLFPPHTQGTAKQVCHTLCPKRGVRRAKTSSLLCLPRGCPHTLHEGQPITEGPLNRKDH